MMVKRLALFTFLAVFSLSMTGCFLLLAGAAGGTGTAVWLSGKLVKEVDSPRATVVSASEKALAALNYPVTKKIVDDTVTQIKAEYRDGRTIWIDVRDVVPKTSKIEVRVGAASDKEAAREILTKIDKYL